jgi:hypothetical protein
MNINAVIPVSVAAITRASGLLVAIKLNNITTTDTHQSIFSKRVSVFTDVKSEAARDLNMFFCLLIFSPCVLQ